ncbi:MAG: response regulator [Gemmatimonadales bacterium]
MAKKRILLVDDEAIITRTLKLYLEGTGAYEVVAENEGSKAVQTAREFRPDLVLLDIMMPDIDGAEVAAQMRDDEVLRGTPVVFLTALVKKDEVDATGGTIGGYPFLAKPLDPDRVVECIEEHTA